MLGNTTFNPAYTKSPVSEQWQDVLAMTLGGGAGYGAGMPIGNKLNKFIASAAENDPRAYKLKQFRQKYIEKANPKLFSGFRFEGDGKAAAQDRAMRALDKADQRYTRHIGKLRGGYAKAGKLFKGGVPVALAALGSLAGHKALEGHRSRKALEESLKPFLNPTEAPPQNGMNKQANAFAGMLGILAAGTTTGALAMKHVKDKVVGTDDLQDPHVSSVRQKLLDRANEKGIFVGYPNDWKEKRSQGLPIGIERVGPFYHNDLPRGQGPGIMIHENYDKNGILAHELGHALSDPKVFKNQVRGQTWSPLLTLGIMLGGKSKVVPGMFAAAATGAKVPVLKGEHTASRIGREEMIRAGETDPKVLDTAGIGLPTYWMDAAKPGLAYAVKLMLMRAGKAKF
jgi:F0F1-type ATP synthase membrane subunit c/vacuolar-type H+-ATPase subunit K